MEKARNASLWTDVGYELFAKEGPVGIQVERLARILQLNKSGFYHYFGDLEIFCDELLKLHEVRANLFLDDVSGVISIDPDYIHVAVKHKIPVMFHIQLVRVKNNPAFQRLVEKIDEKEDVILHHVWSDYIGFHDNPDLAMRYFTIVRDMLYTRLSLKNMNYDFINNMMREAREVMQQILRPSAQRTDESLS